MRNPNKFELIVTAIILMVAFNLTLLLFGYFLSFGQLSLILILILFTVIFLFLALAIEATFDFFYTMWQRRRL